MANIMITEAKLTPNPVEAGKQYILSVTIKDKIYGLITADGKAITAATGKAIERSG